MSIEPRERVCLVGRNGAGKSTLMRVIAGEMRPDRGEFEQLPGLRVAKLDQEIPEDVEGNLFELVTRSAGEVSRLLNEYHHLLAGLGGPDDAAVMERMHLLETQIEQADGWILDKRTERVLDRLGLDPEMTFNALSGGMKRRALLARALITDPDILLLDEPTNHLDIESIEWLEDFLLKFDKAILFVTHDRMFLRRIATRILELERGNLHNWECGFDTYLERREALLEAEEKQNMVFDKKLVQEEAWLRRGLKARRTRNEGRVRALKRMRDERSERREVAGGAQFAIQDAGGSGRKVITAKHLHYAYDDRTIIRDFSTTIWRGDRIGVMGPNGSGKSTLLQLLLGELKPQDGEVVHGSRLEVAYYDQQRAQLDDSLSVMDNVSPNSETVRFNGQNKHILSYLEDFLFTAETARSSIANLSGGERNRLMLARLFAKSANVLVLDEPTNDLDLETVDLLEDLLTDYAGTILLVSHDREFLNNIVTSTIALEGDGVVREYGGGYDDWLRAQQTRVKAPRRSVASTKNLAAKGVSLSPESPAGVPESGRSSSGKPRTPSAYLSQKEARELETIPSRIESLEAAHSTLVEAMANADFYQSQQKNPQEAATQLQAMEAELEELYARWELLEAKPRRD